MTPEEHFFCALMGMSRWERREKVAEFRRSLVEHDTRVIEDFLYGSDTLRLAAAEWADGYKAGLGDGAAGIAVLPAFAAMSTCSRCGGVYPTDELEAEWCEACLRVGGST